MVVEPLIVGLLLAAALMHASWNAILKSDQSDRLATFGELVDAMRDADRSPCLPETQLGARE